MSERRELSAFSYGDLGFYLLDQTGHWGGDGPDVVSRGIQPSLGLAARWQPWEGEHRALMAQMGHQHQRPLSQEELAMLVPPSAGCRGPGVCPVPGALRCAPSSWKGSHMGPPASWEGLPCSCRTLHKLSPPQGHPQQWQLQACGCGPTCPASVLLGQRHHTG